MSQDTLCQAINEMRRVEFTYQDTQYSLDPYILYEDVDTGEILFDGIQATRTSRLSTFRVSHTTDVTLKERFKPIVINSGAPRYKKAICLVKI